MVRRNIANQIENIKDTFPSPCNGQWYFSDTDSDEYQDDYLDVVQISHLYYPSEEYEVEFSSEYFDNISAQ